MQPVIRRILTLFALAASLTVSMAAQPEPLPAPPAPDAAPGVVEARGLGIKIDLLSPEHGTIISFGNGLRWENPIQPDKYVIKFFPQNGPKFKYVVPMNECVPGNSCLIKAASTPLFEKAKDGQLVRWQVVAKKAGSKWKTDKWDMYLDTVNAPQSMMPANGGLLTLAHNLSWDHSPVNASYTLIVREAATKDLVFKTKIPAMDCDETCAFTPGGANPEIPGNITLEWQVKAKGHNGNKAKSHKQLFIRPMAGEAMRVSN